MLVCDVCLGAWAISAINTIDGDHQLFPCIVVFAHRPAHYSECCDTNPGYVVPEISGNVLSSVNSCARKKLNCEKSLTTEKARLPRIRFTHDEWIKFALFDRECIFGDFSLSH